MMLPNRDLHVQQKREGIESSTKQKVKKSIEVELLIFLGIENLLNENLLIRIS